MPTDDYSSAVGGGLKLKGSKPAGVTKKKKKDKTKLARVDASKEVADTGLHADIKRSGTIEDSIDEAELSRLEDEAYAPGHGKTETERKHEEMKRKRVSLALILSSCFC